MIHNGVELPKCMEGATRLEKDEYAQAAKDVRALILRLYFK